MKTYDFVFVYEGKNRELESVCLLACELEKRGYSVKIIETWWSIFHYIRPVNAIVTVGHALYSSATLNYLMSFVNGCQKFVNMQWEQIFTNGDIEYDVVDKNSSVGVSGIACKACHLSWGQINFDRLINKYGVNPSHARIVGNITLDFLRPEFDGFYTKREKLLQRYNISDNAEVFLFISSFAYAGLPDSILNSDLYQNQSMDANEFARISVDSQKIVLDWFERFLRENDTSIIVYRPHPAENDNLRLKEMEKKYHNFYVIGDLSVKQWIAISDKIYTWYSSAITEVYVAKKNCGILRPIEIPYESELEIYNQATFIESYEQFCESISQEKLFPVDVEKLKQFYYIDDNIPAYIKACDYLETIYKGEHFNMNLKYDSSISTLRRIGHSVYMNMLKYKCSRDIILTLFPRRKKRFDMAEFQYNIKMCNANYASNKEIQKIKRNLTKYIEK